MYNEKELTVELLHYEVSGIALIRDWSGNVGTIEMKPYSVKSWSDAGEGINDNGFGAQEILGAKLHVYAAYGPKKSEDISEFIPLKVKTDVMYISLRPEVSRLSDEHRQLLDNAE